MKLDIINDPNVKDYNVLIEIAFSLMNLDPTKLGNLDTIQREYEIRITDHTGSISGNVMIIRTDNTHKTWTKV